MATVNARNLFTVLLLSSLLSACATPATVFEKKEIPRAALTVLTPAPIVTSKVTWVVLTETTLSSVLAEQQKKPGWSLIALTPDGYKNLAYNQAEIMRFIQQQQSVISAYEQYYQPTPSTEKK